MSAHFVRESFGRRGVAVSVQNATNKSNRRENKNKRIEDK